jgi:predicted TIM-barrel fold metal-dependent hydrolase
MSTGTLGFPVVDLDSHLYEPATLWDRYVPGEYRALAQSSLWHGFDHRGNRLTVLNGHQAKDLNSSKIIRQAVWRPNLTLDDVGGLDPEAVHPINPGANEAEARIADMDELGIDLAIAYPTLFAEYFPFVEDPIAAGVLARAYNDWASDFTLQSRGRVQALAVLPLQSLYLAQAELDRVADKKFLGVALRPMFYPQGANGGLENSRFLVDNAFRPLWSQINDSGLVGCIHASVGVTNPDATSAGTFIERVSKPMSIGHSVSESVAYMQDNAIFVAAVMYHGLMEEWPTLKLALGHGGASMIPLILEKLETYIWLGSNYGKGRPGLPVSLDPEGVFHRHPIVVQFDSWERGVALMPDLFVGNAGWGSRYPNHDASTPAEAVEQFERHDVDTTTLARFMGGTAIKHFGLSLPALQA